VIFKNLPGFLMVTEIISMTKETVSQTLPELSLTMTKPALTIRLGKNLK
jgi:hypothetical protein